MVKWTPQTDCKKKRGKGNEVRSEGRKQIFLLFKLLVWYYSSVHSKDICWSFLKIHISVIHFLEIGPWSFKDSESQLKLNLTWGLIPTWVNKKRTKKKKKGTKNTLIFKCFHCPHIERRKKKKKKKKQREKEECIIPCHGFSFQKSPKASWFSSS